MWWWMTDTHNVKVGDRVTLLLADNSTVSAAIKMIQGFDWRGVLIPDADVKGYLPAGPSLLDNTAVERLAMRMRGKLAKARADGRSGWQTCEPQYLSDLLHQHVAKGDVVDVANFCAFLLALESPILPRSDGHATSSA